ncbi:MAG: hypothetical protein IJB76_02520 [Clostridia bacterium]|nr:hypothetical protein [Clostridia bacterium]
MRTTKNPELRVNMPTNITLDEKTASALLFGVREPLLEFIERRRKTPRFSHGDIRQPVLEKF